MLKRKLGHVINIDSNDDEVYLDINGEDVQNLDNLKIIFHKEPIFE